MLRMFEPNGIGVDARLSTGNSSNLDYYADEQVGRVKD
jgi:hypothetical protein